MNPHPTTPARWEPPDPKQLPELRAELLDHYSSEPAMLSMRQALSAGRGVIVPEVPGMDAAPDAVAAQILIASERHRLADAHLYYATADMTALALAAAASPPREKVSRERPPAESGLIVFAEPIGGYVEDVGAALASTMAARPGVDAKVTTPIVAVSWSQWTPDAVQLDQGAIRWFWNRLGHGVTGIPRTYRGLWLTFYSPSGLFSGLAPDTILGTMGDGSAMTAGMITSQRRQAALNWDNETLLTEGAPFAQARPDTTDAWTHVLYTAWQLMADTGRTRWTETQQIPRPRAGAKRDARQGVTAPATVHVVNVHTTRRPPRQRAAEDAVASTGRREPQWSCRWPVSPHRRDHCMNPARHAEGDCRHEDRLIPGYVKGPEDKPLKVSDTVHLWDHQPEQQ
ncbi:hypothetical protein [Streptomyces fulvorobeus]|uniref:Uncharacterized protein n=1 Tax=Streptomyces fulvorobeus TaxID=284028 RepID=A0A7Y9L1C7_9ACTN|nr:hypothetical protein [Streptomyces fulvorobeus]NYE44878.1 hypothetical protein [Streptomyces fulvorobeus]